MKLIINEKEYVLASYSFEGAGGTFVFEGSADDIEEQLKQAGGHMTLEDEFVTYEMYEYQLKTSLKKRGNTTATIEYVDRVAELEKKVNELVNTVAEGGEMSATSQEYELIPMGEMPCKLPIHQGMVVEATATGVVANGQEIGTVVARGDIFISKGLTAISLSDLCAGSAYVQIDFTPSDTETPTTVIPKLTEEGDTSGNTLSWQSIKLVKVEA